MASFLLSYVETRQALCHLFLMALYLSPALRQHDREQQWVEQRRGVFETSDEDDERGHVLRRADRVAKDWRLRQRWR
jgi:hypothetical protein